MGGIRSFAVAAVAATLSGACASGGTSPKAFEFTPAPLADESNHASESGVGPVIIAREVVDGMDFLYRFITETEFVLCLEGSRDGDRIVVDGFRLARMEATSSNSVRYQPCDSPRYIGTAHNHPPVNGSDKSLCYQSEPDRRSFGMDPRAVVDIVLCGDTKFKWWLKDGRTASKSAVAAVVH
jgi:hypothetical protein